MDKSVTFMKEVGPGEEGVPGLTVYCLNAGRQLIIDQHFGQLNFLPTKGTQLQFFSLFYL